MKGSKVHIYKSRYLQLEIKWYLVKCLFVLPLGGRNFGRAFYSSITNKFPNLFRENRQIKE
jgi:hypothetical protein